MRQCGHEIFKEVDFNIFDDCGQQINDKKLTLAKIGATRFSKLKFKYEYFEVQIDGQPS